MPVRQLSETTVNRIAAGEFRTLKRSCTAVESLLTFCPPGPEERTKLSSISDSSMLIWSVMRIMMRSMLA